jgi:hypothetical protein
MRCGEDNSALKVKTFGGCEGERVETGRKPVKEKRR